MKLGYKISKKQIPSQISNIMNNKGGLKAHRYNTRNKGTPNIQKHQTTQFNKSFLCKSISLYGNLPVDVKMSKTLKTFIRRSQQILHNRTLTN